MNVTLKSSRAGFTLIELVISGALMAVILASSYLCLSAGVTSRRTIEARSDAAQSGRIVLQRMAADLRAAVPLSAENEFIGLRRELDGIFADNLDFATRNYFPRQSGESDWSEVSYYLRKDPAANGYILLRRLDPTRDPEPFAGGTTEELARGVTELRFEYYDGFDWYEEWGDPEGKKAFTAFPEPNLSDLPEAVRINLTIDPSFLVKNENALKEPPLFFQTEVRIALAPHFYRTGSSGATNNAAGGTQ